MEHIRRDWKKSIYYKCVYSKYQPIQWKYMSQYVVYAKAKSHCCVFFWFNSVDAIPIDTIPVQNTSGPSHALVCIRITVAWNMFGHLHILMLFIFQARSMQRMRIVIIIIMVGSGHQRTQDIRTWCNKANYILDAIHKYGAVYTWNCDANDCQHSRKVYPFALVVPKCERNNYYVTDVALEKCIHVAILPVWLNDRLLMALRKCCVRKTA